MSMPKHMPAPKQEAPQQPIVVGESDFIGNDEITEADFMSPEEVEALGQTGAGGLLDEQFDDISNVHDVMVSPAMLQKEDVIEAVTFRPFNGVEGGISLQKKRGRAEDDLNQDCVLIYDDPEVGSGYGAFDGLGGAGEVTSGALASAKAVEVLPAHLTEAYQQIKAGDISKQFKKLSFVKLNTQNNQPETVSAESYGGLPPDVMKKAIALSEALLKTNNDVKETGGNTTACFTLIHATKDGKRFAITANIGDGGAILRKKDGSTSLLTKEDSTLSAFIDAGILKQDRLQQMRAKPKELFPFGKKELSYEFLKRANSQALGGNELEPRITITELRAGEEVYNLTDGILDFFEDENGELDQEAIQGALKGTTLQERINRLREIADLRSKIAESEHSELKKTDDMAIAVAGIPEAA